MARVIRDERFPQMATLSDFYQAWRRNKHIPCKNVTSGHYKSFMGAYAPGKNACPIHLYLVGSLSVGPLLLYLIS